ncbi:hypothetical protein Zmor_000439 [Zophobas morio]|uniref:Uncharacterized protein n=1 Tax=Zophobas morio TaxID=2755281 RepID=A0AA38J5Z6_9CUCU|nr:hypothetical protein Zmor_000439 [Zophobas morio]
MPQSPPPPAPEISPLPSKTGSLTDPPTKAPGELIILSHGGRAALRVLPTFACKCAAASARARERRDGNDAWWGGRRSGACMSSVSTCQSVSVHAFTWYRHCGTL